MTDSANADDTATGTEESTEESTGTEESTSTEETSTEGEAGTEESGTEESGDTDESVPETYADFTMPEGVTINESILEKASPLFKELGLSQANAQKLVDVQSEFMQQMSQDQADSFAQTIEGWENDAKTDQEIGGELFEENLGVAKLAIEKLGVEGLSEFLVASGAGSHPAIVKAFVKMGRLMKEDNPGSGGPTTPKTSRDVKLYPNNQPK